MIRANCINKLTSVCTGHCDTCINGSSIYGQSSVDNAELFQENYNKGYARENDVLVIFTIGIVK